MKSGNDPAPTREERLAARLRANLRKRKAQAREMGNGEAGGRGAPQDLPKPDGGG